MRIPVVTDDPGWHGARLGAALARRGYTAEFLSLKACAFDLSAGGAKVSISGCVELPRGVFVRGVPGGSLQQVIMRLDVLHALRMLGVVVYNSGQAIERTVDKAMTSFILRHAGIATPDTWVCESRGQAAQILEQVHASGDALVLKPLFGSQGQGLRLLEPGACLPVPMQDYVDGVYYLQRYVDSGAGAWHDYRVFVIGGAPVGAMVRHGCHWINNVAQGGRCEAVPCSGEMAELAVAAATVLAMDYCGVDLIRDAQGQWSVLEVNSIPAWRGLQSVSQTDIAQLLADDFVSRLRYA